MICEFVSVQSVPILRHMFQASLEPLQPASEPSIISQLYSLNLHSIGLKSSRLIFIIETDSSMILATFTLLDKPSMNYIGIFQQGFKISLQYFPV